MGGLLPRANTKPDPLPTLRASSKIEQACLESGTRWASRPPFIAEVGIDQQNAPHSQPFRTNHSCVYARRSSDIERLDAKLKEYGELLKPARDKIVAHSDLEVHVSSTSLGAHDKEVMVAFLDNLQACFDAAGDVIGVGPLDFRHMPGTGDVIDLVMKLGRANDAGRE